MERDTRSESNDYEAPRIADYGDLADLTAAIDNCANVDGSSFAPAHTAACGP